MNRGADAQESSRIPRWTRQERVSYASQIRAVREARGLGQDELGEMVGVSRGTVSNIERGATVPQSAILWRLLGALDLLPESDPDLPPEIAGWLRVLAPIIARVPAEMREGVMLDVLSLLTRASMSSK